MGHIRNWTCGTSQHFRNKQVYFLPMHGLCPAVGFILVIGGEVISVHCLFVPPSSTARQSASALPFRVIFMLAKSNTVPKSSSKARQMGPFPGSPSVVVLCPFQQCEQQLLWCWSLTAAGMGPTGLGAAPGVVLGADTAPPMPSDRNKDGEREKELYLLLGFLLEPFPTKQFLILLLVPALLLMRPNMGRQHCHGSGHLCRKEKERGKKPSTAALIAGKNFPSPDCPPGRGHKVHMAASATSPWHSTAGPTRALSNPKEPVSHRPWWKLMWSPSRSANSLVSCPTSYLCCCQADFGGEKQSPWSRIFTVWVETCLWGGGGTILMCCQMALSVGTGAYGASHTIAWELQFCDVFFSAQLLTWCQSFQVH